MNVPVWIVAVLVLLALCALPPLVGELRWRWWMWRNGRRR